VSKTSRRRFIHGIGSLIGGAAAIELLGSGNAFSVAMAYEPQADTLAHDGQLFSASELATLHDICERVIPETETPSAAALDVHGFIDNQLKHCHSDDEQERSRWVLQEIDRQSEQRFQRPFAAASATQQLQLLNDVERAANGFHDGHKWSFKFVKNLVVFGYCTTEVGGTKLLAYDPFPGGFKGSVPYSSIGKAWLES
jgi:hypothetical protein